MNICLHYFMFYFSFSLFYILVHLMDMRNAALSLNEINFKLSLNEISLYKISCLIFYYYM